MGWRTQCVHLFTSSPGPLPQLMCWFFCSPGPFTSVCVLAVLFRQLDPPPCSGSARPSGSAWPSRAFPKSIGGVGEPLRYNQPSGPSEFELGRGLPQELGRASIMEESAPLFYVCPRLRPQRGLHRRSGGDDDAGAPAASRPPLGGRICSWWRSTARAEEPSPEATRVTCSCRIRCWALWLCK